MLRLYEVGHAIYWSSISWAGHDVAYGLEDYRLYRLASILLQGIERNVKDQGRSVRRPSVVHLEYNIVRAADLNGKYCEPISEATGGN